MKRLVADIECDGLFENVTRMWIIATKDIDTGEKKYWLENDLGWKDELRSATHLVGHNFLGYDVPVLAKLYDFELPKTCKVIDTLLMSQAQDYLRFPSGRHSLEEWGKFFGDHKVEHEDWSQYSEEMKHRCVQDVDLTLKVFNYLKKENKRLVSKAPQFKTYLAVEHAVATWNYKAKLHGWPFDLEKAKILQKELEMVIADAHEKLDAKLGYKVIAKDKSKGIVEYKEPKWTKKGFYNAHTADWFGIDPCSGYPGEERPVEGPYSRIEIEPLKLSSPADVKLFLFRNGWVPTEWNTRKQEDGTMKRTSPKITEDDLELLGGDGALYATFSVASSRLAVLKTWIENTDENGMLHGDCMTIGTPSMRMRHQIIVNVPSVDKPWGEEMRSLFITKPGWKIIGCDSAGNQARGLAHYLGDEKFIDILLNQDIHQHNADILTEVLKTMDIDFEVPRSSAKRILYAFLFGASGEKLWSYIFGMLDQRNGNKLKRGFVKAVPGFKNLLDKLNNIYYTTSKYGKGYIPGPAGNRIYADSGHKLLVYLLQAMEKATCGAAVMLNAERLEAENIPYIPLIMMHDEEDFMVPEEFAERARDIGQQAFVDGPKLFGVEIMDGDGKIGNNWLEVH